MIMRTLIVVATLVLIDATLAQAHTPLCSCFDNGDESITCEGGFSDGSSASGVAMRVKSSGDTVLLEGKMNEDSEYTFDKPKGEYTVVFDAGEGHQITVSGKEIVE
jgi:hypothetical protein